MNAQGNRQMTPPLAGLPPGTAWPGRSMLYSFEAAAYLECTVEHIRHLIESGDLPAIDIGTGSRHNWRIKIESLEAWLKARNSAISPQP
jgi:excisionase family DNA binding protein